MIRLQLTLVLFAAASTSTGCIDAPDQIPDGARAVEVEPLPVAGFFHTRERRVIRDEATWASTWAEFAPPGTAPPEVDFARHAIVLVSTGGLSGSHSMHIDGVYVFQTDLLIQITWGIPAPGCRFLTSLQLGQTTLLVPAYFGNDVFIERVDALDCD
jgi:hypothetical protein